MVLKSDLDRKFRSSFIGRTYPWAYFVLSTTKFLAQNEVGWPESANSSFLIFYNLHQRFHVYFIETLVVTFHGRIGSRCQTSQLFALGKTGSSANRLFSKPL